MLTELMFEAIQNEDKVLLPLHSTILSRGTDKFYDIVDWMTHQAALVAAYISWVRYANPKEVTIIAIDFWCPGIEQIYMVNIELGLAAKYIGWLHGATFVEGDLLSTKTGYPNLIPSMMEQTWLRIYDEIWHTSKFFVKNLPMEKFNGKLRIVHEPFDAKYYVDKSRLINKERIYDIVISGRLSEDRNPLATLNILQSCITANHDLKILIMSPVGNYMVHRMCELHPNNITVVGFVDEDEYISLLSQSKVVFSAATQEGWGYSVMKAISCGCYPVLPNRAVYPELYHEFTLYDYSTQAIYWLLLAVNSKTTVNMYKFAETNLQFSIPKITL